MENTYGQSGKFAKHMAELSRINNLRQLAKVSPTDTNVEAAYDAMFNLAYPMSWLPENLSQSVMPTMQQLERAVDRGSQNIFRNQNLPIGG